MCVAGHVIFDVIYVAGHVKCCRLCRVCVAVHVLCDITVAGRVMCVLQFM